MSAPDLAPIEDPSLDLLVGIADAISATLRPETGWQSQALSEGAPAPEGARVVQANLAGVGRLVVAVDTALARSVQVGPPPAEDLLDGLTPALQAAAGVVGTAFGADVSADEPQEVSLSALAAASDEEGAVAVLIDGDRHRVTVAVFGPRSAGSADEPAAHAFDDLGPARPPPRGPAPGPRPPSRPPAAPAAGRAPPPPPSTPGPGPGGWGAAAASSCCTPGRGAPPPSSAAPACSCGRSWSCARARSSS